MAIPWRDALKRAAAGDPTPVPAAPIDPAAVSPQLAVLIAERKTLEAGLAALVAPPPSDAAPGDPRYHVPPMAERRAEFARWAERRDAARSSAPAPSIARRLLEKAPTAPPPVAGPLPLRSTSGETPRSAAAPLAGNAFAKLRDAARSADPSGTTDRAFSRLAERARREASSEALLARAKRAIPDDWRARARRAVPALGEGDGYARRAKALLAVAVGSVESVAERARTLRDIRELRAADAADDDARRDRALDRLKAKRAEGG